MSLLFKNLRIHQVFGANTSVGKTVLTTALVRASAAARDVFYLKPVSTGPDAEADDAFVRRFSGDGRVHEKCLYRFSEPVSPHLAASLENDGKDEQVVVPSDATFVNSIAAYVRDCAVKNSSNHAHMYVETAGGVHSPTLSGTTQVDAYRPLFLPTILVGDSRLGGISSTLASYEALLLRGYIIDAVLVFKDAYYRNHEFLAPYFAERGIHVAALDPPPSRLDDTTADRAKTEEYYRTLVPGGESAEEGTITQVVQHLDACHQRRLDDLDSMPRRTLSTVWWPFVQHGLVQNERDVTVIDSAHSDFFSIYKKPTPTPPTPTSSLLEPQLDGSASWWTQAVGHAHPRLALAAARAAGRYGHVMFPQATHAPALTLAERLVAGPGRGWASRVFFSDDGATGMEVALKMALRAYSARHGVSDGLGVLGLKGSYHGDTIGAMDACEDAGVYTCEWHDAKGFWFDPPRVAMRAGRTVVELPPAIAARSASGEADVAAESLGWVYDVGARLDTPLARVYREYVSATLESLQQKGGVRLAALVLEPLVMGAGGMIFVDPLFQRVLVDVVRGRDAPAPADDWSGMPVIFDEVFVGLYRLGLQSTGPLLGAAPDISVHAKILTGGLLPLAATLASEAVFRAFWGESKTAALLHGHSYTAHAVGCEVANETLDMLEEMRKGEAWAEARGRWVREDAGEEAVWSFWDPGFVEALSCCGIVSEVMTLGTVLAVKIKDSGAGYASMSAQTVLSSLRECKHGEEALSTAPGGAPYSVHFRTLGDVAYFMLSLNTPAATVRSLEDKIWAIVSLSK